MSGSPSTLATMLGSAARGSLSAVTLNQQSIDEQQRRPFNDLACSQAGVYEAAISGTMF